MTDDVSHIEILRQGMVQWNRWRDLRREIQPNLRGADLHEAKLSIANLSGADLSGADLSSSGLINADLSGAKLNGANLRNANLRDANLSGTDLRIARLDRATLSSANLHNANLRNANLRDANLSRVRLDGADLSGADLSGADLSDGAHLRGAHLRYANLSGANLHDAYLHEADLSGARLQNANLQNARLNGARLNRVEMERTNFSYVDLRETKGLAQIEHKGPSIVQLHTIQLPQDGSALHFLRGVGVPDEWIDFWRTTMMQTIQYHSLFISYSSKDDVLARRLHADLQDHGVRCWFAPEDMKIGDKIRARIDEAIHLQDKLLLLLSEHAIQSIWVEDEVEAALEKEQRQQREMLFPVCLDESVMQTSQAWAAKLRRTRHIGDFTCWKDPQAYQQSFERLLRDLKAEGDAKEETSGETGAF